MNQKRQNLAEIEQRFGLKVFIEIDDSLQMQYFSIEKSAQVVQPTAVESSSSNPVSVDVMPSSTEVVEDEDLANKKKKKRRKKKPTQSSTKSTSRDYSVKSMDSDVNQLLANSTIIKAGTEDNLKPANNQITPQQPTKMASDILPEIATEADKTNLAIQNTNHIITDSTVQEEAIPKPEAA